MKYLYTSLHALFNTLSPNSSLSSIEYVDVKSYEHSKKIVKIFYFKSLGPSMNICAKFDPNLKKPVLEAPSHVAQTISTSAADPGPGSGAF
jgi:hypothetical protein